MSDEPKTTSYYRPQGSSIDDDGTITLRVSVWDEESHCSCRETVQSDRDDYAFWRWLVEHPDYQRTLDEQALEEARDRFELESSLA